MNASLWLAAGLACATWAPGNRRRGHPSRTHAHGGERAASASGCQQDHGRHGLSGTSARDAEVSVPEGDGTLELLVTPLPAQAEDRSLYTEGAEGLRVLSTRFRTDAVKDDTRQDVRAKEESISKLQTDAKRLQKEIKVQDEDLKYLEKLGGFTGTALSGLTEKGRLDSEAIISLSKFIMENRNTKTKAEVELRAAARGEHRNGRIHDAADQRAIRRHEPGGTRRRDRGAKAATAGGHGAAGLPVNAANWWPQYRLRGDAAEGTVRLEYLAAVVQQTGESWSGVRITLSTARPSLDAAPPELIPLKMDVPGGGFTGPIDAHDDRSQGSLPSCRNRFRCRSEPKRPSTDVVKYVKSSTKGPAFADGIPIYVDPIGLSEADKSMASTVHGVEVEGVPLRTTLKLLLHQLDLTYVVRDGLLRITSQRVSRSGCTGWKLVGIRSRANAAWRHGRHGRWDTELVARTGAGGGRRPAEPWRRPALRPSELRVVNGQSVETTAAEKAGPSVTFPVTGRLDIPSRKDPQLLEVARVEMPAEYYAKAVPVMTPRVYRLAKLTNKSDLVLLPGEATVYVGSDFVGRMRLPLVTAGEPFIAGFGVDTQLQVSRRLVRSRARCKGATRSSTTSSASGCATIGPIRSKSSYGTACPSRRARRWRSTWSRRRSS